MGLPRDLPIAGCGWTIVRNVDDAKRDFLPARPACRFAAAYRTGLTPEGRQRQTMSQYEITYIIRPLLEDPQVDEVAAHFSDVAKQNGGEEIGAERMGKRRLAYEIQKLREGHYVCMKFKGAAACADEIIRQMRLHENVLRALVVRV